MNREILFRGKRTDNGEWVNGYVTRIKHSDDNGNAESYYFNALDKSGWVAECVVSAETVGQYTGLTDRNGRKIFDGDIILFEKKKYFVVWLDSIASFVAKPFEEGRCWPCMNVGTMKEAEVIGNIFDNPELMENLERSKK